MSRRVANEKTNVFAPPWLRESEYDALRAACTDTARLLPHTYERWRRGAEDTERRMQSFGYAVMRVDVDLDELRAWCVHEGHTLDVASRFAFAKWKAGIA